MVTLAALCAAEENLKDKIARFIVLCGPYNHAKKTDTTIGVSPPNWFWSSET
jgi:hypothetical protein